MRLFALLPLLAVGAGARAQPVISQAIGTQSYVLRPDANDPGVAYYPPGRLRVALDPSGQPEVGLVQLRYTGTRATGDQGKFITRSVLSFRLTMERPTVAQIASLAADYRRQTGRKVTLKPLPIKRFETELSFMEPGAGTKTEAGKGTAEGSQEWSPTEFWSERSYVLFPSDTTSQLLAEAFKQGQTTMTFSYGFVADGVEPDTKQGEGWQKAEFVAASDAIPIAVDVAKSPNALRQIDLNEKAPANYPLLAIYCFAFQGEPTSLVERQIEIEATGIKDRPVRTLVSFRRAEQDVTFRRAKFTFAVKMNTGYRYRLRDIDENGTESYTEWKTVDSWAPILDVTKGGGQ